MKLITKDFFKIFLKEMDTNNTIKILQNSDNNRLQFTCRCKFCGDSYKHLYKHHMYVLLDYKENVIKYNCFICNNSGTLNKTFLNVYDFKKDIIKIFNSLKFYNNQKISISDNNHENMQNIYIKFPKYNDKFEEKHKYMMKRTKIDTYNRENMVKYKIIYDFISFFNLNSFYIPLTNRDIYVLQKHYIGFLSINNSVLICRNIHDHSVRYKNITINKIQKNILYAIKGEIDLSTSNPSICISEGIFDIINIYNSHKEKDSVYFSCNGIANMANKLRYILKLTKFFDAKIKIYSDNDVDNELILKKMNFIENNKIYIYKNNISKDFGQYDNMQVSHVY